MNPFVRTLLDWYATNGRELPWRGIGDAYAIWLSEVILQQTRIEQGRSYWHRFMRRWPTVEQLSRANEDEVLREWQGLGYYSRARNLLIAARQITEQGGFPRTSEALMRLKGVGTYTATAVASFAFGEDVAAVDGNVLRVLSRVFDIYTPVDTSEGKKEILLLANELLPHGRSADYNQALMDFGALQCTPSPHCNTCCMTTQCEAFRNGMTAQRPVKSRKQKIKSVHLIYIYVRTRVGDIAIHRREAGSIWQGLWEPPVIERNNKEDKRDEMVSVIRRTFPDLTAKKHTLTLLADNVKHQLTHRTLHATFFLMEYDCQPSLPEGYIWVNHRQRDDHAVPRLVEKLYEIVDRLQP